MTRLIDADALFINLDGMMGVSPTGYIHGDTVADMISDATTVDAIPVEWIKRWSKEPMTEKDMKLAEQCEWNILEWLIADWQRGKKNDIR